MFFFYGLNLDASFGCETVLILAYSNSFHNGCHFQNSVIVDACQVKIYVGSICVEECLHHLHSFIVHASICCLYHFFLIFYVNKKKKKLLC